MDLSFLPKRIKQFEGKTVTNITPLEGGLTNKNFKIKVGDRFYAVRCFNQESNLLDIYRESEYLACALAAQVGVAPKTIAFLKKENIMVFEFISGKRISLNDMKTPRNIKRVAKAIKSFHSAGKVKTMFSPFKTIENYRARSIKREVLLPDYFPEVIKKLSLILVKLEEGNFSEFEGKLCHNDLLNANFIDDESIKIIDWEYAGMGNALFDLANFSSHHEFSKKNLDLLIVNYFGNYNDRLYELIRLMELVSYVREGSWALLQISISGLDFNYQEYADKYFYKFLDESKNI